MISQDEGHPSVEEAHGKSREGPRPRGGRWAEWIAGWKQKASNLKVELHAIYLAYRHPGVPWHARVFAALVLAYAFSPIDLIPDPIPVLGYLDDLILVPLGIALALKMIPREIMIECRETAREASGHWRVLGWPGAVIVIALWILLAAVGVALVARWLRR